MERWAANTLRTLGIILTAGFVLVASLLLVLLSMCAAQPGFGGGPGHPSAAIPYLVGAGGVVILGVCFITWLARGILRSRATVEPSVAGVPLELIPPTGPSESRVTVPLHLSPLGRKAVDRLVYALGAQIALSAITLIFNQLHFWSGPHIFAPLPSHNWFLFVFAPFVLYHIPYAILIYVLVKQPDRRAFTYALAVPSVLIMQALMSLGYFALFANQHPVAMVLLLFPWAIHIVILVLAYQAIQQVGIHPQPSSLMIAAVATFLFFSIIHVITPFLYRFTWR